MKNIFKAIALAAIAISAASCISDDQEISGSTIGTLADSYLLTDYGWKLIFKTSEVTFDKSVVKTGSRVYVNFNYLYSEMSDTEVKGTMTSYHVFNVQDILKEGEYEPEDIGNDGIYFPSANNLWASGGYVNACLCYYQGKNSNTAHTISMVYNEQESVDGDLVFEIHHNAFGETIGYQGYEYSNCDYVQAFLSFNYLKVYSGKINSITVKYNNIRDAVSTPPVFEDVAVKISITDPA